eukprot:3641115-Rhodomonas_salina.4
MAHCDVSGASRDLSCPAHPGRTSGCSCIARLLDPCAFGLRGIGSNVCWQSSSICTHFPHVLLLDSDFLLLIIDADHLFPLKKHTLHRLEGEDFLAVRVCPLHCRVFWVEAH